MKKCIPKYFLITCSMSGESWCMWSETSCSTDSTKLKAEKLPQFVQWNRGSCSVQIMGKRDFGQLKDIEKIRLDCPQAFSFWTFVNYVDAILRFSFSFWPDLTDFRLDLTNQQQFLVFFYCLNFGALYFCRFSSGVWVLWAVSKALPEEKQAKYI